MKIKKSIFLFLAVLLSGCSVPFLDSGKSDVSEPTETVSDNSETILSETETEEIPEAAVYIPTESDLAVVKWFSESMTDAEEFSDLKEYEYYARTLGKDKEYFLSADMWEVFYNKDIVNINADVDEKEIYLIRLDPYKLIDLYAENNGITADELCSRLSVTKEQLYYNWGFDPASVNYAGRHKENTVTYSDEEAALFGKYNGEKRDAVLSTHMIVIDNSSNKKKKYISYESSVSDDLKIYRRDNLKAFTDTNKIYLYSGFSEEEKSAAFKVNGIGIRAVIPLSLPNAFAVSRDSEYGDDKVTVMLNVSPFSYGCTDSDKLNISAMTVPEE